MHNFPGLNLCDFIEEIPGGIKKPSWAHWYTGTLDRLLNISVARLHRLHHLSECDCWKLLRAMLPMTWIDTFQLLSKLGSLLSQCLSRSLVVVPRFTVMHAANPAAFFLQAIFCQILYKLSGPDLCLTANLISRLMDLDCCLVDRPLIGHAFNLLDYERRGLLTALDVISKVDKNAFLCPESNQIHAAACLSGVFNGTLQAAKRD